MTNVDEVTKTRMWQDEGRIVICNMHITTLSDIERIYWARRKIRCGYDNCKKDGAYEVLMKF